MAEQRGWRALIYNRASADPSGRAVSVASQLRENEAWCAREGWTVAAVITDNDRSATRYANREREGYRAIWTGLADQRWGRIDVIVAWESSRNQRDLDAYVEMRELCVRHDVRLAYKGRVYDLSDGDDRFTTALDSILDEREAERARERTRRSHRDSVEKREPRGSIPYGYVRTYRSGTRRLDKQVPDPQAAPVVRRIVAELLAGDTLYGIAKRLNDDRIVTPQGARLNRAGKPPQDRLWTSTMLRNLLRKPSLAGIRTHNGVEVGQAAWPAIVEPSDWHAVQAVLDSPGRAAHQRGREPAWLLSGIAVCDVCEGWLRPMRHRGRMTYRCDGRSPTSPKGHVSRDAAIMDAEVINDTVVILESAELQAKIEARREDGGEDAARARKELADLLVRRDAFLAKAGSGSVPVEMFEVAITGMERNIEAARARLGSSHVPAVVVEAAGPNARQRWNDMRSLPRRRELLRAVVEVRLHRSRNPDGSIVEEPVVVTPR